MGSSFFTNEENNTLKNKINNILEIDKNIEYLDFLIGYFRITGFNKISDNLSKIEHIRILVGINADKNTFDATQLIKKFAKEQVELYNEEPLDIQEYQNFESMKELIVKEKIEVRISANRNVHSKMYIMRSKPHPNHKEDCTTYRGSVIIGSSNLTHNGLEGNTEINAELTQERDIVEAVNVFEKLWTESVELTEDDFNTFITPNLKKPSITPYQLYIKLLMEHFGDRIDFIDDKNIYVPQHFKKLSYQVEAVNDGLAKLKKHNGFFLSDVVGLGKTVVIAMLIKKEEPNLKKKVLVVIPPAVRTQWENTFYEFNINSCDIVSLAKLSSVNPSDYEIVVVDESHKFKNSESKRYKQLYEICLNKKVILLSATPQNNTPNDLYNQIALFQNVKNSTLQSCTNLQSFFIQKEITYKNIINNPPIDEAALKKVSEEIRDNILRTLMIRRTRYDIQHHDMYKVDIEKQGLTIPKVNEPHEHEYKLEGKLGEIFDETAIKITQKLNYSRFNTLFYLSKKARLKYYPHESANIFEKNPLSGLMKTLLIKRFESSFSAFKISITRHLKRYEKFIENFEKNIIYLGEKATDILDFDEENDGDYDEFIENLIKVGRVKQLSRADFKEGFEEALKSDLKIFKELVATWKEINKDPKLDKFREVIKKDSSKKIVIFTESVDTLNYLKDKLVDIRKILFITSQNREEKKQIIQENFDANYPNQKDNYNIIITTDTLAEGINLHKSNIIYNYDIPWNATKLIQRIGRINRIGTKAEQIHIHNFKPASHIDDLIELSQKAFVKLQSSHTMMGEDNQIYTKNEKVSSVNLFESYKQESLERDEELDYLEELRIFKEKYPNEFKYIEELNKPLSLTREINKKGAYVILDIDAHKNYVYVNKENVTPISFIETAEVFRATADERSIKHNEADEKPYNLKAIGHFQEQAQEQEQDKSEARVDSKIEQEALTYLEEWYQNDIIGDKLFDKVEDIILNRGDIFMAKNIKSLASSTAIKKDMENLVKSYAPNKKQNKKLEIKVILTEIFKGKK